MLTSSLNKVWPHSTADGFLHARGGILDEPLTPADVKAELAIVPSDVTGLAAVASSGSASDLSTGTLSIARIADADITLAKIQNLTAGRILGRASGAGSGVATELTAAQVKTILAIAAGDVSGLAAVATSGSASDLGTGTLPISRIAAGDVTYSKIQNVSATDKLLGRSSAGAGSIEEIALTAAGRALIDDADAAAQRTTLGLAAVAASGSASDLGTGSLPAGRIPNSLITLAMMADLANGKIIGRNTAGAGVPEALSTLPTAAMPALTGDVTTPGGSLAATIANQAVTYAKMQNVSATARLLGRNSAGAGSPEELTGTQATALLDAVTSVAKGLVPATGGGTVNFLRADATFANPDPTAFTTLLNSADQDVTNASNTDSTDLQFATATGKLYAVECLLLCAGNNATGDFEFRFVVAANTMDGRGNTVGVSSADATNTLLIAAVAAAASTQITVGTAADLGFPIACYVWFAFRQNTGNSTFKLQFGNASASGGRTSRLLKGSYLKYRLLN